jgi:hypothetical protein
MSIYSNDGMSLRVKAPQISNHAEYSEIAISSGEIEIHLCKGGFRLRVRDAQGRIWESRTVIPSRAEAISYVRKLESRGYLNPDRWRLLHESRDELA